MTDKPLRVAVVGLGFMGGMHVAALQSIPAAELVAVYSRDERKLSGDLSTVGGNLAGINHGVVARIYHVLVPMWRWRMRRRRSPVRRSGAP